MNATAMHDPDKAKALEGAKRRATGYLVGATLLFVLSLFVRGVPAAVIELLRSTSEAAMVGGLADWFAVTALFRPVTLLVPIFPAHTAVVPRNKERIATSLGDFVQTHFFVKERLVALLAGHDPARFVARWLLEKENADLFGRHAVELLSLALKSLHDEKVQGLIAETVQRAFKDVDLSRKLGEILELMLKEGRHHQLLDEVMGHLTALLRDSGTREAIAGRIADYIQTEYPKAQVLLPTELIGRHLSEGVADYADRYLANASQQPGHELRQGFDRNARALIVRLKGDSEFARKGEEIKAYILGNPTFGGYIGSLWASIRDLIEKDLQDDDSTIRRKLTGAGRWLGHALARDPALQVSLNRQVLAWVERFGPQVGPMVSKLIASTIREWDARTMGALIEENIGSDLQKIRINGTLIGGVLGAVLYGITEAAAYFR